MHRPHGGKLVNRVLDKKRAEEVKGMSGRLPEIVLTHAQVQDVFNITHGVYSPLEGFMSEEDFKSVIIRSRLARDLAWTIPVVLDVDKDTAKKFKHADNVLLKDEAGEVVALLTVWDTYGYDKTEYAKSVFGTSDKTHPGVKKVFDMKDMLVGGMVDLVKDPKNGFMKYTLTPKETRVLFREKGWVDIAGFQTRNIPHLGHEYVQKTALSFVDGIFINPVIGKKKKGDFKDEVILEAYDELIKHYFLKERAVMSILLTEMRYAGPKEAVFHAIVRKNFGCTHFIVGRDHAGVGDYYGPFAAHDIFDHFSDLEITPIFFKSFFYCNKCASIANDKTCPHSEKERINFKGTDIRNMLQDGKVPPESMMRPEVARIILSHKQPFVE
ncbi:MAG: sulfate adenylyltransferase [Candidatus Omnitrophota bacterium]|jgi:sulfate adenylyltransferase